MNMVFKVLFIVFSLYVSIVFMHICMHIFIIFLPLCSGPSSVVQNLRKDLGVRPGANN